MIDKRHKRSTRGRKARLESSFELGELHFEDLRLHLG